MNNTETKETAKEPKTEKTAFEICEEYEEALIELESMPEMLEVLIRRFNLDNTELTAAERFDLGNGHRELYSVLGTMQRLLWKMYDKVTSIELYKS